MSNPLNQPRLSDVEDRLFHAVIDLAFAETVTEKARQALADVRAEYAAVAALDREDEEVLV